MLQLTVTQLEDLTLSYITYIDSIIKVERYKIYDVNTSKLFVILANAYKEIIEYYNNDPYIFTDDEIREVVYKYNDITGHNLTI
jgi:hypothetical protein